ncbi:hypothetical protein HPB52_018533 [Rhipicephalus sanguineus]|uniref:Ran GTPase-activating protein n=1 Tax=Rhipicephalus sanguineus TaxID=34632 RepID=A0A9D4QF48_RHISA|nr:hypothetical protein HPB52_018533 [Rhipicephalus sanguineus]
MPRARKRAKYCDPSTEDVTAGHVDTQGTDVQELYKKGLEISVHITVDLQGKELGTSFSEVFRGLDSLELSCVNTGSGFANHIASYIRQNKTLRELRLRNSCGGDEGAAVLIEALVENDTLKIFALNNIKSSSDTLVGFAKMLATNRTLEMVHLGEVCCGEVDKVWSLLAQERYAGVFQRLQIVWPDELLSVLTALIRREACSPTLYVRITSSVDEGVLREFFEAYDKSTRVLATSSTNAQ